MVKLPKQWRSWCADQKLRTDGRRYGQHKGQWYYLKGRGYHWRVNCHGMFERGDSLEDFDRWARCKIDSVSLPKTRAEFQAAVKFLLEQSNYA